MPDTFWSDFYNKTEGQRFEEKHSELLKENAKLKEQLAAMTYEMNHYKQMCKQLQSKDEEE